MSRATLDSRLHLPADTKARPGREFVLYWMQSTHRAHDNFGLNFAIERANELGLPLQVYHGLSRDYPWASDRFHTWILQSVVDLYADFEAKGIGYAFWLDTSGKTAERVTPLDQLARRAALVVTDFSPTFIFPRRLRDLRRRVDTPVIAVDSATLIPMAYHAREYSTARGIRPVLMDALPHFLWPVENPMPRVRRRVDVGFEEVFRQADRRAGGQDKLISGLVAECDIDHSVPPSPMFRGGTRAGRERLQTWLVRGLPGYEEGRSNPDDKEACSRLSPWLHFGNLSIHEILLAAREAGPESQYSRFLDEALTWRELAHNFCYFNPRHRTLSAVPTWALDQLKAHESDPRPELYSRKQLEQAATGDELWNACQRCYVNDGWMHNYLRMLWGKAVLMWTRNAAECLAILEELNNKYSLDGRDPNSYAGFMWILGKFDRPFYTHPIYGSVRYMSLKAARKKFRFPLAPAESAPSGGRGAKPRRRS